MTFQEIRVRFPHADIRSVQEEALAFVAEHPKGATLELPTGSGKTAIGWAALLAAQAAGGKGLFYVTPTKTLADQVQGVYGKVGGKTALKVLGRAEYPCLYYRDLGIEDVTAQESPCYMLACGHRVDQATGNTEAADVEPCPYYRAKHEARRAMLEGGIVVTTTAFFLMNRLLVAGWSEMTPALVVVDEAHRLAPTARSVFEHTVTDWHLKRVAEVVERVSPSEAKAIREFYASFIQMVAKQPARAPTLMKDDQLKRLMGKLEAIDAASVEKAVRAAVRAGEIDPVADREALRVLTGFIPGVRRLLRSFAFSLEEGERKPLNYVVAFHYAKEDVEGDGSKRRARYFLTVKSYYVAPVIRKALAGPTLLLSATIGDAQPFEFETGMRLPFKRFGSNFSCDKTRVFLPTDTPNLSYDKRQRDDLKGILRRVAEAARRFAQAGHRSLVVVVSEEERQLFLRRAELAGLNALSYGESATARESITRFRAGEGDCLVGTVAQYGEGVDLPSRIAPIIFFLRPSYPHPGDPLAQFEERRFGGRRWALWRYRAILQALQVRGRNVRDEGDVGVTFFLSQQFRDFLAGSLPSWLRPAYEGKGTFEEGVERTLALLK